MTQRPTVTGADAAAVTDGAHEHHLTVSRSARYYLVGTPTADVRQLWIALHGYGQLAARFIRHFVGVAEAGRLVVAPEALSRFYVGNDLTAHAHAQARVGATWMTREDRLAEISDYVGYLDTVYARVLELLPSGTQCELGVLGFSQGAATACRWTAFGKAPVRRLVVWAGGVPDDLELGPVRDRLAGRPLELVIGDADPYRTPEAVTAQLERLRRAGVPARFHGFAGGHQLDAALLQQVLG